MRDSDYLWYRDEIRRMPETQYRRTRSTEDLVGNLKVAPDKTAEPRMKDKG
jgi:hypothetical protein